MWLLYCSHSTHTHSTYSLTHSSKSIANTPALLPPTVTALPLHDRDAGAALSSLSVHSLTHSLLLACASQYITSPHYLTAPHRTSLHRMPLFSSEIDLGPVVGVLSVLEVDPTSYYSSCLKQNSSEHDSTGSRVYTACHVLCRFIALFPQLFKNKRVVEIGCGVGVASIVACATTELEHALLTDGNDDVIAIAKLNIDNAALSLPGGSGRASAVKYSWGDISPGALTGGFDVVLGAELTYYNTDMNLLVSTVVRLLNEGKAEGENSGLFIHAHIFRKQDQEEELIQCFSDVGWSSAEVAVTTVVSAHELGERGNAWCRVRCLVSGPRDVIATLIADDPSASFFVFRPQNPLDDEDDESVKCDNTEDESFGLGSLFT